MKIVPLQLVIGLAIFALFLTAMRWFNREVLPHWVGRTRLDRGVGVAYAYLDGAGSQPGDIRHTRVFETYARYPLAQFGDISADVQWISDQVRDAQNPQLWVIGTRLNLYF